MNRGTMCGKCGRHAPSNGRCSRCTAELVADRAVFPELADATEWFTVTDATFDERVVQMFTAVVVVAADHTKITASPDTLSKVRVHLDQIGVHAAVAVVDTTANPAVAAWVERYGNGGVLVFIDGAPVTLGMSVANLHIPDADGGASQTPDSTVARARRSLIVSIFELVVIVGVLAVAAKFVLSPPAASSPSTTPASEVSIPGPVPATAPPVTATVLDATTATTGVAVTSVSGDEPIWSGLTVEGISVTVRPADGVIFDSGVPADVLAVNVSRWAPEACTAITELAATYIEQSSDINLTELQRAAKSAAGRYAAEFAELTLGCLAPTGP
jgi:hypothetical protein